MEEIRPDEPEASSGLQNVWLHGDLQEVNVADSPLHS